MLGGGVVFLLLVSLKTPPHIYMYSFSLLVVPLLSVRAGPHILFLIHPSESLFLAEADSLKAATSPPFSPDNHRSVLRRLHPAPRPIPPAPRPSSFAQALVFPATDGGAPARPSPARNGELPYSLLFPDCLFQSACLAHQGK